MPDCIIKSGEVVHLDDERLNDPSCVIEPGAIIRPPAEQIMEPVAQKVEEPRKKEPRKKDHPKESKIVVVETKKVAPEAKVVDVPKKKVVTTHREITEVPAPVPSEGLSDSEIAAGAAVLGIAAVGTAAATSAAGGITTIQAKLASIFGSKATAATAVAGVTAGTIVAVKALEAKMNNLERDMKKAKEEVGGAASSINRIDELLSRLGGDGNDKLDPPV